MIENHLIKALRQAYYDMWVPDEPFYIFCDSPEDAKVSILSKIMLFANVSYDQALKMFNTSFNASDTQLAHTKHKHIRGMVDHIFPFEKYCFIVPECMPPRGEEKEQIRQWALTKLNLKS